MAGAVEQAEFVGNLTNAEADVFNIGDFALIFDGQLEMVELRTAVAIRPPEARVL
jgi:hypothetical protein